MNFKNLLVCCSLITLNVCAADQHHAPLGSKERYTLDYVQDMFAVDAMQCCMEGCLEIEGDCVKTKKYGKSPSAEMAPYFKRACMIHTEKPESWPLMFKVAHTTRVISLPAATCQLFMYKEIAKALTWLPTALTSQKDEITEADQLYDTMFDADIWKDELLHDELPLQMLRFNEWLRNPHKPNKVESLKHF